MDVLETIDYRGYRIEIVPDDYPEGPREWDNIWSLYCFHQRYIIGDKHDYRESYFHDWDEFENAIKEDFDVIAIHPLSLYDHGGTTLFRGVHRGWDNSRVGFAFVTRDKLEWFDKERPFEEVLELMENNLDTELETYNQWANGEVYGYQVKDEYGEFVDSCYGHYGMDYCIECAKETVDSIRQERGELCIS